MTHIRRDDGSRAGLKLHRLLLPDWAEIDHIDGDGLNNCRSNLRAATHSQNQGNTRKRLGTSSQFKGVCWSKCAGKWRAYIRSDGKLKFLGYFASEFEAAQAYNSAALEKWGSFAKVNCLSQSLLAEVL
jgi:hypothetical protein